MYIVYKHTTPCGKVYIGITSKTPSQRWQNGKGYKTNPYFWKAIQKYGWENIKHEILFDSLTKEEACQKEIELIAAYCSTDSAKGYNIDNGGSAIGSRSEETKKKISLKNSGKIRSLETRKKISAIKSGRGNQNYGKHLSEEHRRKIGDAQRGGKHPFAKAVVQLSKDGKEIKTYPSTTIAEAETGVKHGSISAVCKGKYGCKTAGGYIWRYAD